MHCLVINCCSSRNLSIQLRQFKPEAIIYLPSSSGTLGGFLRGAILKLLSRNAKTALIYLQPRSISPAIRVLAHITAVDVVFAQSHRSIQVLKEAGFNTCWIPGGVDTSTFIPIERERKDALQKEIWSARKYQDHSSCRALGSR